jgi:hypothetical protein
VLVRALRGPPFLGTRGVPTLECPSYWGKPIRRHGEKIASRGGKNAKKRAVVAVARKLAVLLHSLWISAEVYEPLRNAHRLGGQAA